MKLYAAFKEISSAQRLSAQRLLNQFVNESDIGLAIFDNQLCYEAVNPWLANADGLPVELHIGKHLKEVIGEAASWIEPVLKVVLTTGRPILNFEIEAILKPGGERKYWSANFFPLKKASGNVKRVAAIFAEVETSVSQTGRLAGIFRNAELLRSWKEIAQYMGTCVKTVQRWEQAYDLPIRRIAAGKGAVVFALRSEMDNWMRSHPLKKAANQK